MTSVIWDNNDLEFLFLLWTLVIFITYPIVVFLKSKILFSLLDLTSVFYLPANLTIQARRSIGRIRSIDWSIRTSLTYHQNLFDRLLVRLTDLAHLFYGSSFEKSDFKYAT